MLLVIDRIQDTTMNNHYKVENDYIKALVEQAAWKPSELVTEDKEVVAKVEAEVVAEEEAKEHACPLCESILAEEISEDVLMEHIKNIEEALLSVIEEEEKAKEDEDTIEEMEDGPSDDDLNKIGAEKKKEGEGKKGPSKMDLKAAYKKYKTKGKTEAK
tara:strand:+ start:36921 stop:37397 length:477 start_codon:yes stop_codon:yes gene_type:complete